MSCELCEKSSIPVKGVCAYCERSLDGPHEHDHMPVPRRLGGAEIVPVCLTCHDFKDRLSPKDWNAVEFHERFAGVEPTIKLMFAALLAGLHDAYASLDAERNRA